MSRPVAAFRKPIRLDLNTSPFLNEAAVERAWRTSTPRDLASYPEPGVPRLEAAVAATANVPPEAVIVGDGSDEVLDLAMRALVPRGGSIGVVDPSFGMYDHFARANGLTKRAVPAKDTLPVDELVAVRADAYFVPSPNNPTGTVFPREGFEALMDRVSVPVVIDEAYAEFARQDYRDLAGRDGRGIVTRTFSKAYGLPGIRVGYAIGPPALIGRLRAIRMPYNLSSWSERVALAALGDPSFPAQVVAVVESQRGPFYETLRSAGWPVWPSRANFLFVGPLPEARRIWESLREGGIYVKLVEWPGGKDGACLRITVGSEAENAALISALAGVPPWRA